jgi:DNA-binding FadR family transcriptional regulator
VLQAIQHRDAEEAERAVRQHLEEIEAIVMKRL